MASGKVTSALETSPVLFSGGSNRSSRLDSRCVLDSEVLHVDCTADAAGPAIHLGHGHDGGDGREGRGRPWGRGGRLARGQEFGGLVYWRLEEPDLAGPSYPAARLEKNLRQAACYGCTDEARGKHVHFGRQEERHHHHQRDRSQSTASGGSCERLRRRTEFLGFRVVDLLCTPGTRVSRGTPQGRQARSG